MATQITPHLLFDGQAEEAAKFYTSFFKDGKITRIQRYGEVMAKKSNGRKPSDAAVVAFELNGQAFTALNGCGSKVEFSEAVSFQIECADQAEVDHYWGKLSDGGDPTRQRCGWVADKFGVSWQVVPKALKDMISDPDPEKSQRTFGAMMKMTKLDIAALKSAYDGF